MVLNISGINKLTGHIFHNRTIQKVSLAARYGVDSSSYVFHFPEIPHYNYGSTYKQWEDEFEIHLYRRPKNGKYELFWMGLHGVTCMELGWKDIQNFSTFISSLGMVVERGKRYWTENR